MADAASRARDLARKAGRHVYWARTQGVGRLIEEDQLDPRVRVANAWRKRRWRRAHGVTPGTAVPVFLVGVQRSGTNMLVRGLEMAPEFEVHNENDRRAFDRFELRGLDTVRSIVGASRHRFVLFKPLCDSHRTDELLDGVDTGGTPRAVWAYRDVDGRVRSALAKFGPANLEVLTEVAAGRGLDRWQARRLSPDSLELIRSFDWATMSPASAAALFWYVRNRLYFETGLHDRDDVTLVSYQAFVADPEPSMRSLCGFLGLPWDPALVAHVDRRAADRPPEDIHPEVRRRCDELEAQLAAAAAAKAARTS